MNTATAIKLLFSEEHVSVSSIGTYLRCPRQYRFRYVDRAQVESRSSALVFGSAIHEALAFYYGKLRDIEAEPTAEELGEVFLSSWKEQLRGEVPVLRAIRAGAYWCNRDWMCKGCAYAAQCVAGLRPFPSPPGLAPAILTAGLVPAANSPAFPGP